MRRSREEGSHNSHRPMLLHPPLSSNSLGASTWWSYSLTCLPKSPKKLPEDRYPPALHPSGGLFQQPCPLPAPALRSANSCLHVTPRWEVQAEVMVTGLEHPLLEHGGYIVYAGRAGPNENHKARYVGICL